MFVAKRVMRGSCVTTSTVRPALCKSESSLHHGHAALGIEVARRFIGEDQHRVVDQRPRHRDALLLSAG
ncbi:MAG: hypothetical protein HND47_08620 [Chloroflexi bacterium]|nr:hypothetical protein [Chloroflexota bacterium]